MIERRTDIVSQAEFYERYVRASRPVIMTDLLKYWPALRHWNPDLLKSLCGDQKVQILANRNENQNYETSYDQHRKDVLFGDYVDMVLANPNSNDIYLHAQNQFMLTEGGKRLHGYIPPLAEYLDDSRRMGNSFVWFGPADTVTPLHHDNDNIIFAQVYGRKRWTLISPRQKPLLYNDVGVFSSVNLEEPDLTKHPLFRFVKAMTFDLLPGEVLFLPVNWWHHVRALDVSISLSFTNFYQSELSQLQAA